MGAEMTPVDGTVGQITCLYEKYHAEIFGYLVKLVNDRGAAEDLAQETLIEAWRCIHRYDGRCQFFTWLCAILLNRYRNSLRGKRPLSLTADRLNRDDTLDEVEKLASNEAWPDESAQRHEQAALVRKCVEALPPKHQQVVHLRFYVDDSLEGIAAAVGCSAGTVKSRLFHALEKLREMKALNGQFAESERKSGGV